MNPDKVSGVIEYFPAHPDEGSVGVPADEDHARVVAIGTSQATRRPFNLIVAFESTVDDYGNILGRATGTLSRAVRCLSLKSLAIRSKKSLKN